MMKRNLAYSQLEERNLLASLGSGVELVSGDGVGVTITDRSIQIDTDAYQFLGEGEVENLEFCIAIEDGNGGLTLNSGTVSIFGANDAPTVDGAVEASFTESEITDSDVRVEVDLLQGSSDVDRNDVLAVADVELVSGNSEAATVENGLLIIDSVFANSLGAGVVETLEYQYNVVDNNGGSVEQTATITLIGENDAPTVDGPVIVEINEDVGEVVAVDLLTGANDVDNDELQVVGLTHLGDGDPSGITFDGNQLLVDPAAYQYLGEGDTINMTYLYWIVDPSLGFVQQTATITLVGANDAPVVAGPLMFDFSEDEGVVEITELDLLFGASDIDQNDFATINW